MATSQAELNRARKPSPINGQVLPAGFEAHPERRFNGHWKKEDSARYKLEQMLKLTDTELEAIFKDQNAPLFERKLAQCISQGEWKQIEGMINQVYGYPKQSVEMAQIDAPIPLSPRKKKE